MPQPKTLLTADEFFRLYSHKDGRYELVDGEVVEMASVNEQHGDTAFNISGAFFVYSRQRGIGRGGRGNRLPSAPASGHRSQP